MSKNRMALPKPILCNFLMLYRKHTSLQNVALNISYAKSKRSKNMFLYKRDQQKGIYTGQLSFCWLLLFACEKNEHSVLVAVKLTSGLYTPEEFWRLTLKEKKKKIFYTSFKIAWEKKINAGDGQIQFHHCIENYGKLYYTENSFPWKEVWTDLSIWLHMKTRGHVMLYLNPS